VLRAEGLQLREVRAFPEQWTAYDLAEALRPYAHWQQLHLALPQAQELPKPLPASLTVHTLSEMPLPQLAYRLATQQRRVTHSRHTQETQIDIELLLEGTGRAQIHTGIGFFDHLLDQLARHGGLDLSIRVAGDLHIDEHHTIEDTALALGEAFRKAIGNKLGMNRYGFCLPMDDCLAQVAIDFGGRPWLVWQVDFRRERIGEMPTEMFSHFFKSFADAAACNLNIRCEGENEHHKIESVFKAWARAIRLAVQREAGSNVLPSTKGVL
jgi:imidazoleglycerol-phosphate dehydratase/histidinol-phosphatase